MGSVIRFVNRTVWPEVHYRQRGRREQASRSVVGGMESGVLKNS
jgi:hypothetical protein